MDNSKHSANWADMVGCNTIARVVEAHIVAESDIHSADAVAQLQQAFAHNRKIVQVAVGLDKQLGFEDSIERYSNNMVAFFRDAELLPQLCRSNLRLERSLEKL